MKETLEYNREQINSLYLEEQNKTNVAKKYAELNNIPYTDSIRRVVSKIIGADNELDENTENISTSVSNEYTSKGGLSAMRDGKLMNIEEYCSNYGLDYTSVTSFKLITHTGVPYFNIVFKEQLGLSTVNLENSLDEIVQKYIKPVEVKILNSADNNWFDRLVYTDVHISMSVNGSGDPLYDGKWDKEEILRRLNLMIAHVLRFKRSSTLIIDELGDFEDGLGGETTRKGHKLPQNMTDIEAFDLGLQFKISIVDELIKHYDTIICNNLNNDNHSGVFSYFVNSAVKSVLEAKYPDRVTINNQKKFIDHYSIGKHTFIQSHGKDSESLKFGFKPHLDDRQAKKIDHYIKENNLYNGNLIEFSKGDSHLGLFDESTSTDFHYYNYPSFSPPSNWVKTNFSNTASGFRFFNIDKESFLKIHIPYIF